MSIKPVTSWTRLDYESRSGRLQIEFGPMPLRCSMQICAGLILGVANETGLPIDTVMLDLVQFIKAEQAKKEETK